MKVLGFTGFFGAGKGTAIHLVSEMTGAAVFSTSEELADECRRRGLPTDRPTKYLVANDLREKFGPGELSRRVAEKIRKLPRTTKLALVDALRTHGEVQVFRDGFGKDFALVSIEAPAKARYERVSERARDKGDALSYEQFLDSEKKENRPDAKPFEQNLGAVAKLADYKISNDGSLKDLNQKLHEFLLKHDYLDAFADLSRLGEKFKGDKRKSSVQIKRELHEYMADEISKSNR